MHGGCEPDAAEGQPAARRRLDIEWDAPRFEPSGVQAVSYQQQGARPQATAWRTRADGSKVFQLQTPVIFWWAWVVFALVCLGDIAVQGRDRASVQAAVAIITATGFAYACAFRPKVIADDGGITVLNPVRDFRIPWPALRGIFLGDSVEFQSARSGPKGEKTVYSWALYTKRRSRARARMRGNTWDRRIASATRPSGYARLPKEAQEATKQVSAEVIARELGRLREQAQLRMAADDLSSGAADGLAGGAVAEALDGTADQALTGTADQAAARTAGQAAGDCTLKASWAWLSLAAMLVPATGLVLAIVIK
jgi:Bacterial PH domain